MEVQTLTKLGLISDLHYYSPALGTTGKAYCFREATAQTCLKESPQILKGLCDRLASSDIDALVIPGDVTNNGERASHEEAISLLNGLSETKTTLVLTSTHDWSSNGLAKKYVGDTEIDLTDVIGTEELPGLYEHFGRQQLVSSYTTSLKQISKSCKIGDVLVILANEDCDGAGGRSGYSEKHLAWVKNQITYAKENSLAPILFQHHMMIYNISPLINKGQSISDGYKVAEELADAGLRLVVTGHSHFQRISQHTSSNGNTLTQLNLGAISGFPGLITYLTVNDGEAEISLEPYGFDYDGKACGEEYLKAKTLQLVRKVIHSGATDTQEFAGILSANGIPSGWVKPVSPLVKSLFGKLENITVAGAAKKINRLMLKKVIPENLYTGIADKKLMPLIEDTFLCLFFDEYAERTDSDFRQVFRAAAKIPAVLLKRLPMPAEKKKKFSEICLVIEGIADNLTTASHLRDKNIKL